MIPVQTKKAKKKLFAIKEMSYPDVGGFTVE
jgi:hypothetical protein